MLEIIIDHDIIVNEDDEKLRKLYNEMEPKSFQCCSIKKKNWFISTSKLTEVARDVTYFIK